jgi:2-keto-myo-inositol isomerase
VLFGFGWGVANMLFGLSVPRAGMALSFAIVVGMSASSGGNRREVKETMRFALNHMVAPLLTHEAFFDLAASLRLKHVEIRNDLAGMALLDGTAPAEVGTAAAARGLSVLSINALQRFNDWTPMRAVEAKALTAAAKASGAAAIVLCPVNDPRYTPSNSERLAALGGALQGLKLILVEAGIIGLIEPLGFAECSFRRKSEAVAAIAAVDGAGVFRLVHDTFHHFVAGEEEMFPECTGLVHVSGVTAPDVPASAMRDQHRMLVDRNDRLGSVAQLRALASGGYRGPVSFEPFAASVHTSATLVADLRASLDYLAQVVPG